jgi:hypothetical protein
LPKKAAIWRDPPMDLRRLEVNNTLFKILWWMTLNFLKDHNTENATT